MAMEDLSSLFFYQESVEELKQKLLYMTYELQSSKMELDNEVRKNKENMENMKQLLRMLQISNKERDEAREQIQKLLSAAVAPPMPSPESPLFNNLQGRTSSGVTESNSFSDTTTYTTYNNNNNNSPGDSLYDVVSPGGGVESGSLGFAQRSAPCVQGYEIPAAIPRKLIDPESEIIYEIAKGRPLPQKGKLLEAVMDAGPLLQTLMVAGPLPRWRNPPPAQTFQVPPVGFDRTKKQGGATVTAIGPHSVKRPINNNNVQCGTSSQLAGTNSVLNFSGGGGFGSAGMIPRPKRQRIQ